MSLDTKTIHSYQLLGQAGGVTSHGAVHSLDACEFGVLPNHPLGHFSQRQQQRVPVVRVWFQSIAVRDEGEKKKSESLKGIFVTEKCFVTINYVDVAMGFRLMTHEKDGIAANAA